MAKVEVELLLVEDRPADVKLTLRALSQRNLANKVKVLRDGAEVLDYLFGEGGYADRNLKEKPKVILLDLRLPKVGGIEVLRRIKADDRTRTIPVVVLTTSRESSDLRQCYDLGVNSYIVKPVDFDKFAKAVADLGLYWLLLNEVPD